MTNQDLGYHAELESYRQENNLAVFEVGRVISEHKERYIVKDSTQEFEAELMGNLRFSAEDRYDLPAVGDWVAFSTYDEGKALIHAVYPRSSIIERQAVAKHGQIQIIATNIDYGLIVQAVDRDFSINRLERYLTICHSSKVAPIIVLSKIDLVSEEELKNLLDQVKQRITDIPIITVSMKSKGYKDLDPLIKKGKTYCLLGSSGVGKSTLLNSLSGKSLMKTGEINESIKRGRHVTSHRELILLAEGGILIDNPGMREVGIADTAAGLETTFETLMAYAEDCQFNDCSHVHEKGCAILKAVEEGEIDQAAYDNFQKMEREKMHFEMDVHERRKRDKKFGKMVKGIMKEKKKNKY